MSEAEKSKTPRMTTKESEVKSPFAIDMIKEGKSDAEICTALGVSVAWLKLRRYGKDIKQYQRDQAALMAEQMMNTAGAALVDLDVKELSPRDKLNAITSFVKTAQDIVERPTPEVKANVNITIDGAQGADDLVRDLLGVNKSVDIVIGEDVAEILDADFELLGEEDANS